MEYGHWDDECKSNFTDDSKDIKEKLSQNAHELLWSSWNNSDNFASLPTQVVG